MNTAIIVAAGSGSRFAADKPKQFIPLLGKPVIIHTLERFQACPVIDKIILVLSGPGRQEFALVSPKFEISKLCSVVTGGETRAESVRNGLDAVDTATANVIAIHDGARPLVTVDEITRTVAVADETGAACLVAEVTDTIKEIEGNHIVRTVDRNNLRRALTPQAFRYDLIRKAVDVAGLGSEITDECSMVEQMGVKITLVEGYGRNIKITRAEDLALAEVYLSDS